MRKGVSDLHRRSKVSHAANERYLDHLAAASIADTLHETASEICKRIRKDGKRHRALNPWNPDDYQTFQFLAQGEHQLNGFINKQLREALYGNSKDAAERKKQSEQATRRIRLLQAHGLLRSLWIWQHEKLARKTRDLRIVVLKTRKFFCRISVCSVVTV